MESDWTGKFDDLSDVCEVVCTAHTANISSTDIKVMLAAPFLTDKLLEISHLTNALQTLVKGAMR